MAARDAMTYINDMDDKVIQMFIDRLEFRGKDRLTWKCSDNRRSN